MRAGSMDRQITIQTYSAQQNSMGETEKVGGNVWIDYATVWAEVIPLSGRELLAAQQISAEINTKFRIWYLDGFSEKDRIVYAGKNYGIASPPIEIGRREGMEILATYKQAEQ